MVNLSDNNTQFIANIAHWHKKNEVGHIDCEHERAACITACCLLRTQTRNTVEIEQNKRMNKTVTMTRPTYNLPA